MFHKFALLIWQGIKWFLASFDNSSTGSSGRKWSAFVSVFICLRITEQHTDKENLAEILTIWLFFAAALLGIVTVEQVIKLRESKKPDPVKPAA
jgi:hypothetical protein